MSADGRRLAIARVSGTSILDVDDGRKLVTVAAGFAAGSPMVFSPDGRRLALTASDRPATVCEVASGRELQKYQGASPGYKSMAFSPDGRRLAAGGADGLITLWNVSTGRQLLTLRGHSGEVISLSFSPDGSRIASFAGDGRAKVWDATEAQEFLTVAGVNDRFFAHAFAYSPDGRRIAMAELTGRIGVYDIRHGEFPILIPCSDDRQNLRDVAYSPDGGRLAAAGSGGTVWVWDLTKTSARLRYVVPGTVPPEGTLHFRSVRFSPDGSRIALDDWNDFVIVCDADSGRVLHRLKNGSGAPLVSTVPLAFSPDGRRLATSKAERITLWDVSSGAKVTRLQGQGLITCLAFSPDGGRLAASSSQRDGAVKVWDTASGAMVLKLQGQIASGGVKGIAYSPDGRRLASFGNDAKIKLWDTASGQEALSVRLEDVDAAYPDLAFSPDGRHLAFVAADGSVRILDGSESTPEQQAELQARRGLRWSAWKRREVQTSVAQHDWNAAKQHLDQLAAREPLDGVLVVNRAITAYHLGRWADALADFSRAEALPEAPAQTWLAESLLRWARGDEQGSRRVAGSLLERMGTTEDPRTAATVAWANVLVHQGGSADSARVRTLAQLAARSNPENVPAAMILGLALYRAGRYDEALKGLEPMVINSRSAPPGAPLILAMIHQRLGQPGEARHWLDKAAAQFREADSRTPPGTPRLSWDQRLEYQRLRGEAEALILWDPIFPDDPFTR